MNTKIIGLALLIMSFVFGQSFDIHKIERDESAQFNLKADGQLNIKNKYGFVHIKTWDKQETSIKVHIKVDARNEKKAQEIMDRINIKFAERGNDVFAETEIGDSNGSGNNWNYNTSFKIDYEVMMPKNAYLNIYNKYGNTEIMALDRNVNAEIKYGHITMGELNGDLNLMLGYGKAFLKNVQAFEAEIKYSDVELGNANDINIHTKYSKINMRDVGHMKIESKYDTYRIGSAKSIENSGKYDDFNVGSIGQIDVLSKYTDVNIGTLHGALSIDQKYGDLDIQELGSDVPSIYIESQYMDCKIHNSSTGYTLDFDGDYSDIKYHDDLTVKIKDFDGSEKQLKGHYGNGQTKINVIMKYGGFRIN